MVPAIISKTAKMSKTTKVIFNGPKPNLTGVLNECTAPVLKIRYLCKQIPQNLEKL